MVFKVEKNLFEKVICISCQESILLAHNEFNYCLALPFKENENNLSFKIYRLQFHSLNVEKTSSNFSKWS